MCGIFGILSTEKKPIDLPAVQSATSLLRHRGPDDEGYLLVNPERSEVVECGGPDSDKSLFLPDMSEFMGQDYYLALGHRRLSILDTSSAGHQPMAGADRRSWIVYNGEVYNYRELGGELFYHGCCARTGTDTEVILAAYERWGAECLPRFNGMWAFAIWDNTYKRLFLARDRFGIKPLYYTFHNGLFVFASEIKALIGCLGLKFEPDDQVIYHYIARGQLPNQKRSDTFFCGVRVFPAGSWMTLDLRGAERTAFYYFFPTEAGPCQPRAEIEVIEGFKELFTDSVRLRLRADVPIGTCLSGGVDSSSIVCTINRLIVDGQISTERVGPKQRTFSAVYEKEGPFNERAYIDEILKATQVEGNYAYPTAEQLQKDIEKLIWHQDEPFGSTSIFAQWCVMRSASDAGVVVLLDGQGADEILAGYRPYTLFLLDVLRESTVLDAWQTAFAIHDKTGIKPIPMFFRSLAFHLLPKIITRKLVLWQEKSRIFDEFLNRDFREQAKRWNTEECGCWIGKETLSSALLKALRETSLPDLLRYEDRNSMAFGIEARVPFLDYRLVEYAFRQAGRFRIHDGWTKWVLRKAMDGVVPARVIWRRDKVGFETPQLDLLMPWIESMDSILNNRSLCSKYMDVKILQDRCRLKLLTKNSSDLLWRLINLEIWLRVWSKQPIISIT